MQKLPIANNQMITSNIQNAINSAVFGVALTCKCTEHFTLHLHVHITLTFMQNHIHLQLLTNLIVRWCYGGTALIKQNQ